MRRIRPHRLILVTAIGWLTWGGLAPTPGLGEAWWTPEGTAAHPSLDGVLGQGADSRWDIVGGAAAKDGGPFRVEMDPLLGRPVMVCGPRRVTLDGKTAYGDVEITCQVRLATSTTRPSLNFYIHAARNPDDPKDKGLETRVVGSHDKQFWIYAVDARVAYVPRAYPKIMPTWDETIRIPIERDMADLPKAQDMWLDVRYQLSAGQARVWVDDRLVLDKHDPELKTSGVLRLVLDPDVRVAELKIRPLPPPTSGFELVPLTGYARDRALLDGEGLGLTALPYGRVAQVQGIPFRFADRPATAAPDHIDVGRSLLRQGNMQGYFPSRTERFVGAFTVDPARLQLRVPNGLYDALYVIAGFDAEAGSVPTLTASFYRPGAGFPHVFEATVPSLHVAQAEAATPLPVTLEDGRRVNLWLVRIPLAPGKLSSFADLDVVEIELAKEIRQYRSYPDPYIYGWHPAGRPSGVHVYGLTLHRPDIQLRLKAKAMGHVWTAPATPAYAVALRNRTAQPATVSLCLETESHDGQEVTRQEKQVPVPANKTVNYSFVFPVKKNGTHSLKVTMTAGDRTWVEERQFARLAADTRAAFWEDGQGPLFGYWSYHGGHNTPPGTNIMQVMRLAGARGITHRPLQGPVTDLFDAWKWQQGGNAWPVSPQRAWAGADPLDPEKVAEYKKTAIANIRKHQGDNPPMVTFFPEPHISRDLTAGNPPDYWGEPAYEMDETERMNFRVMWNTAKVAAEAVRAEWPDTKILIPWGDPLFIVPFLREGFPKELIDGSGLDMIGFERLPEQQIHQMSTHRLYFLLEEYRRYGMPNPLLQYVEGIFVPTEPGACTWQEQADSYHRWSLISLAYGVDRFLSGWFAYDCGNYYGAEHYGGCGIQRRVPYADPKPAYAHFATMTRMLERSHFDSWLSTGSHSVYCLKFTKPEVGPIYALWTIRGKRPVTLALGADATVTVTDSMDNGLPVKTVDGSATFTVTDSPVYVTGAGDVMDVTLGAPDHSDAVAWSRGRNQDTWQSGPVIRRPPVAAERQIADLGDGSWTLAAEPNLRYENNNYDTHRFLGNMSAKVLTVRDHETPVLAIHLWPQERDRQLMPWYSRLKPRAPIEIPGKAAALGLWVHANSDWGRVVYSLRDAKGEEWLSVGTKDQWNCNDIHGWSKFCFDGWRYLRFELPSHSEYDSFREVGTTWWGSYGGDGIVDLPLTLDHVIVERRTHVIYVNDIQPANPADVLLGSLVAEYTDESDATQNAVAMNRVRMPLPEGDFKLRNPIRDMQENELPPVTLEKVTMPDWGYDGTRAHVHFSEVPEAAQYQVWVAAYPDGRGAVVLGKPAKSGQLIGGLRPAMKLYLWVTYTDAPPKGEKARTSRPSERLDIDLVDAFGQK